MCPNSPARPKRPRYGFPSMTMAPPMPVPRVTRTTSGSPCTAPKRHSAQPLAFASFSTTTWSPVRPATASRSGSSRHARWGANSTVDPEASTNPAAPIPTRPDVVLAAELIDDVTDRVEDGRRVGARRVRAPACEHASLLVDDAGGDLGAADIDADGELVGHDRQPSAPDRARSAAPMMPASLPSAASRSSAILRCSRAGRCSSKARRTGSSRRSPASATPPPIAMTLGIEHRRERRDALAQPLTHVAEQVDAHRVTLPGEAGDHLAGDGLDVAGDGQERLGLGVVGLRTRPGVAHEGPTARVLLEASALAAPAQPTVGNHADVADLGRGAEATAHHHAPMDDAAAHAGADGDEQQVVGVLAGAEAVLAPGRGVGVVLDDDREVDQLADGLGQRFVDPVDVGGERHRGAVDVDEAGRADADAAHVDVRSREQPLDQRGHHGGDAGGVVRRGLAVRTDDAAVGRHETSGDLGATDVDTDAVHSAVGRWALGSCLVRRRRRGGRHGVRSSASRTVRPNCTAASVTCSTTSGWSWT